MYISHFQNHIRQQTTTVDYKRLFNGLVLTRFASLRGKTNPIKPCQRKNHSTKKN